MPSTALHPADPQQMSSLNLLSHEKGLMGRGPSTLPLLRELTLQSHLLGPGLNADFDINSIPIRAIPTVHKGMILNYKTSFIGIEYTST